MKTRKMTSAALPLVLSAVMAFGLAAPARAMDFGLSGLDASLAAQSFQQQVELNVNLASLQAEAAQSSAQWQAESSLAAAQQELNALQNTPVVSEGGNLNGGLGDPNTIIVSEGGNLNGGLGDPNTIIVQGTGAEGSLVRFGETLPMNYKTVDQNYGTVQLNYGTVDQNFGTVTENEYTVGINMNSGKVVKNGYGGTVQTNQGIVTWNYGTVEINRGGVAMNIGAVSKNEKGIQTNEAGGIVDNYTNGIVTLNKEGGIVFNYGGSITENLGIELFQVTINRSANTSVTKAADGLTAHNGEAWKEKGDISGQTATVTISPAAGYSITNIAAAEGISPVQNADGTWTVTVDASLVNANEFTLDTTVTQDEPPSSYPSVNNGSRDPDPYFYGGYSDPAAYDDYDDSAYYAGILSLLNITMEPSAPGSVYNAGPNAYDRFNDARIAELSAASENGTVTIDLRETGWTTLKREVFEAAARRGDVTIVILYNHFGRDYTLTIPAGTDYSVLYEAQFLEVSQLPALLHLTAV
ncbi:MAG: hypothetical protein IJ237_07960 [Oscillospiraceae bacterium]|nr:hypothetical protein [Oscillospiraceae bacterium]